MALYIFSDAHLGAHSPEVEAAKLVAIKRLFEKVHSDGDRLIILGDLFDFWFEYKHAIPKTYHRVLVQLTQLVDSGIKVDYVSGNHDFWMDDFFEKEVGVKLHRDIFNTTYNGKKLHLLHGDGLAKADRGYRVLKSIFRNRLNIRLYRLLPPDWAFPLAKAVSGSSREYTSKRDNSFAVEYEAYAKGMLGEGYDVVVIGHLHLPVIKVFDSGVYINSGDFISHFSYVKITDAEVNLEYLK